MPNVSQSEFKTVAFSEYHHEIVASYLLLVGERHRNQERLSENPRGQNEEATMQGDCSAHCYRAEFIEMKSVNVQLSSSCLPRERRNRRGCTK